MNHLLSWFNMIIKKRRELRRWQRVVTVLAAVITFATTYALILPAITVEREHTDEVAGMYLEQGTDREVMWEENAIDPTDIITASDQKSEYSDAADDEEISSAPAVKTLESAGRDYTVILTYDETSGITEEAYLNVSEITEDSDKYQTYLEEAKKAMGLTEEETLPRFAARFFDIKIMVGEDEFTPENGVSVEIKYAEPLAEEADAEVSAVHFADDPSKAEVIEANASETQDDGATTVEFTAESFSVYGVIYTVDFHWEVKGKTYDFSFPGGGFVSFKKLMEVLGVALDCAEEADFSAAQNENNNTEVAAPEETGILTLNNVQASEETEEFIADVESVSFSSPDLVWIGKTDSEITVGELKEKEQLDIRYSMDLTEEQVTNINAQTVGAGEWVLISLQPFDTQETLTVTMKNGEEFVIKVTDDNAPAPQAPGNPPSAFYGEDTTKYATKINLFDYGPTNNSTDPNRNLDCEANNLQNNGTSNLGINEGHALKFFSYGKKPSDINRWDTTMGINNFSGGADAVQGIVDNTLDGLYPKLVGGENLGYLFDSSESGDTKQVYSNVNNLFQRDANGKFFYDSNNNYAYYNPAQGDNGKVVLGSTFQEEGSDWGVGFFPFDGYNDYYNCIHGDGINWCANSGSNKVGHYNHHFGMSMNVDFMMSSDQRMSGQEMIFNFRGDDDMWVFVDGVLILDIGGVHNPVGGMIDFTHQTVQVTSALNVGDAEGTASAYNKTFAELFADAGQVWDNSPYSEHTLKVFYLERGGCYSNLQVEYNLTRYIDYEFYKKDQYGEAVPGAKFALYKEDGTRLIKEVEVDDNGNIVHTTYFEATSEDDGRVYFDHVPLGKYEIREIETPEGYVKNGATFKAILEVREKSDAPGQYDAITYLEKTAGGVTTRIEPKEIINFKDVEVVLEKGWNDNGDTTPPEGAKANFTLMRKQKVLPNEVTVVFQYSDGTEIARETKLHDGDIVTVKDYKLVTQTPGDYTTDSWRRITNTATALLNVNVDKAQYTLTTSTVYKPTIFSWGNNGMIGGGCAWEEDSSTSTQAAYTVNTAHADGNKVITLKLDKTANQFERPPVMTVDRGTATAIDEWEDAAVLSFTLPDDADEGESWKKTLQDLPAADAYGNRYKYYIVETGISGVENANRYSYQYTTSEGSEANPLENGGDVGIVNIAPEKERITATKVWLDHRNQLISDSEAAALEVKFKLVKGSNDATSSDTTSQIEQTVSGNGTATWVLRGVKTSDYSVVETAYKLPGQTEFTAVNPADIVITGNVTNGFTISNKLPSTEISVTKKWKDGTAANLDKVFSEARTIEFTLYQKLGSKDPTVYTGYGTNGKGTITYTPASGSTAAFWSKESISNLPRYVFRDGAWYEAVYFPVETEIDGVTITYQKSGGDPSETPSDAASDSGNIDIINTDIHISVKIDKVDSKTKAGLSGARFQLTRKLPGEAGFTKFEHSSFEEDAENDNKNTGPFTVSSNNGIVLEDLLPGEYRIEEKTAPSGYIITLSPFVFRVAEDGSISSEDADSLLVTHLDRDGSNPEGFQIANEPGAELPHTGGPGTRLYSMLGSILLAGAGLALLRRMRMSF